jgi:hypothetical protein
MLRQKVLLGHLGGSKVLLRAYVRRSTVTVPSLALRWRKGPPGKESSRLAQLDPFQTSDFQKLTAVVGSSYSRCCYYYHPHITGVEEKMVVTLVKCKEDFVQDCAIGVLPQRMQNATRTGPMVGGNPGKPARGDTGEHHPILTHPKHSQRPVLPWRV